MSGSKAANALGGKTARACDSCLVKRARWFCTADDAFLCQACDASVHSANQLASRHERVRLETSSFKGNNSSAPSWHQGFTRKARTPRQPKSTVRLQPPLPLVPEINNEDLFLEENDEQFIFRVPVFDPFGDEFCTHEMVKGEGHDLDLNLQELLMSGGDVEFPGDVESLFGNEKDSSCGIDIDLGMERVELENINDEVLGGKTVKVEESDEDDDEVQAVIACHFDPALDMELNWDFDYASSSKTIGEEIKQIIEASGTETTAINNNNNIESGESDESLDKKRMLLRLNYDAVIAAWASQGSPWTNGIRPNFYNLHQFMDACFSDPYVGVMGRSGNAAGREARVSRYREKRRTRLFSKKIRYQVRKLNAEKRPRMKGRFVKRTTNFSPSNSLPSYILNKC